MAGPPHPTHSHRERGRRARGRDDGGKDLGRSAPGPENGGLRRACRTRGQEGLGGGAVGRGKILRTRGPHPDRAGRGGSPQPLQVPHQFAERDRIAPPRDQKSAVPIAAARLRSSRASSRCRSDQRPPPSGDLHRFERRLYRPGKHMLPWNHHLHSPYFKHIPLLRNWILLHFVSRRLEKVFLAEA